MKFNFHTHTHYCDGKSTIAEYVQEAVNQKFTAFGFSSHAPLPFDNSFSIKEEEIPSYAAEISQLKEQYKGILPLFSGLECDYIPNASTPFQDFKQKYGLDFIIGGVHLVQQDGQLWFIDGKNVQIYDDGIRNLFGGDSRKAVKQYFYQLCEMIEKERFDIVAHLDKIKMHNKNRYFTEDEKWYVNCVKEALQLIKEKGLVVEINTRGIYKKRCDTFYPSLWVVKAMKTLSIPLTISTDAHHKSEISLGFADAKKMLEEMGVKEVWWFGNSSAQGFS